MTALDITSFDTSNVTTMENMFKDCSKLKTIYVSEKFKLDNVTNSTDMFLGCTKLTGENGTVYNSSNVDKIYARIDKEGEAGYFTNKPKNLIEFYGIHEVAGVCWQMYAEENMTWKEFIGSRYNTDGISTDNIDSGNRGHIDSSDGKCQELTDVIKSGEVYIWSDYSH